MNNDLMSDEEYDQIVRQDGATVAAWRCVDRWLVRWRSDHPEDDRCDLDVLLTDLQEDSSSED